MAAASSGPVTRSPVHESVAVGQHQPHPPVELLEGGDYVTYRRPLLLEPQRREQPGVDRTALSRVRVDEQRAVRLGPRRVPSFR